MSDAGNHLTVTAEDLRREFDEAFSRSSSPEDKDFVDLLNLRVGTQFCAVRLAEVGGLFAGKVVTPVPSATPDLIGIAGFRGAILPIFDLGALLGSDRVEAARWVLTTASKSSIGLAFTQFEGYRRVRNEAIAERTDVKEGGDRRYTPKVVREPDGLRPLVHLPSLAETIQNRIR